ncbi:MAG: hypothetical protein V4649_05725 [Bacteroidota bacterium]
MPLPKAGSSSLIGNSFFIFISRFFPSLASLLVIIWYSKRLPEEVYGQYQHFWIQLYIIYPLICFGIHVLLVTYSPAFIRALAQKLTPRHYALYGIWALLLSTLYALLQQHATGMDLWVPFLFILFFSLSLIIESVLIVQRRFAVLVPVNIIYAVAYCTLHWWVWLNGFSLPAIFGWLLVITAARLFVFVLVVAANFKRSEPSAAEVTLRQVRSLWLHLGVYDILQVLFSWVDKFIISLVLTASLSAVYFNGSLNIPFLPILLSAAGSAVLMQLAGTPKNEQENENTRHLMLRTGRMLSCIVFPIFFYLFTFRSELFGVLLVKYAAAVPVFAVSILVLPVRAYSFTTVLQRFHKGALINIGAAADLLLACALMYPLYLWLGLPGVALSFVITTYLQAAFYLYHSARLLGVASLALLPYANWLTKLIVFALLFIAIHYAATTHFTPKISLFLGAALMAVTIAISLSIEFYNERKNGRHAPAATAERYQ